MTHATALDVLIVYNGKIARSAKGTDLSPRAPFEADSGCNPAYAYFLTTCHKLGLRAGLSSSTDIIAAGTCSSYWTYQGDEWIPNNHPCRAKQIFDKFSPKDDESITLRHLLFSQSQIKSFSSYTLFKLFFDKQKTYRQFEQYAIPTVALEHNTLDSIKKACTSLSKLVQSSPHPQDFGHEIILKDRYGAGGRHIYKFKDNAYRAMEQAILSSPHLSFIMQPLVKFDRGFTHQNQLVSTDIRLIYLKGKIISSYIRIAKAGDFRCNQHQGGSLAYLKPRSLPPAVLHQSKQIAAKLNKKSSLFTLDFLVSNSGHAYLLEGNTGPGLTWDPSDEIDKNRSKKLVRQIAQELLSRSKPKLSPVKQTHSRPSLTTHSQTVSIMV